MPIPLNLADFDYALPPHLIAQTPLPQRSASRLLAVDGERLSDAHFSELPKWLRAGDLLIMNDSRVVHARLLGRKQSGGRIEILVERALDDSVVLAQVRASKALRPGSRLWLEEALDVEVLGREGEFYRLRFAGDARELVERHGRLPLPPYIERAAETPDEERYQTVYAREKGSVAAPTAGLHFDRDLLAELCEMGVGVAYVTLHVGAGTFQPVRVSDLAAHRMHAERYMLPQATADAIAAARSCGGRIVAVGTTTVRTLESWAKGMGICGDTAIFITPGFQFQLVDLLVTNFHLPKSSLMMLVSAFAGYDHVMKLYRRAIEQEYRFFSYGDAMLLERA